jgi:hypothetical protein
MPDAVKFFLPYLACCLPLVLVLGAFALFMLLPIFQAPKVEKVIRAARKRLNGDPNISRDQLREHLRDLYYPAWARHGPRADSEVLRSGALFGIYGVFGEMFGQMRWSLASMVIDGRIDKALDIVRFDEEGGPPRRRRRRGRRD